MSRNQDMLQKVKELHKEGWAVELFFGYYKHWPHFVATAMKELEKIEFVSDVSVEAAFEKVYSLVRQKVGGLS